MNSFRSKPVGWRHESYRHYLAAKGISTAVRDTRSRPTYLASKGVRTNHKYYYTSTYVAGDLPLIAGDAVGTVGASAVSVIPIVIPLALVYGGAVYLKNKKKKTGSYFVEKDDIYDIMHDENNVSTKEYILNERRSRFLADLKGLSDNEQGLYDEYLQKNPFPDISGMSASVVGKVIDEQQVVLDRIRESAKLEFDVEPMERHLDVEQLQHKIEEYKPVSEESIHISGRGDLKRQGIDDGYEAKKSFNPMRPIDTRKVPKGNQWLAERKWDGTRIRMEVKDEKVDLVNRRQNDKTKQFPDLQVGKNVKGNVIVDGEVIVPWGKTGESFQLLSQREHTKDAGKISELSKDHPARFIAFDILEANGKNLMSKPFMERKDILQKTIRQSDRIREVQTTPRTREFTENMRRSGAEGVVFKDKNSLYLEGKKTKEWQKLKFKKEDDVEVTGYERGEGKRAGLIGALQTKKGKIGTGFTDEENKKLKTLLDDGKHPVVRVEYRNIGSKGAYREPVYVGLRSDIKKSEAN